MDSEQNSEHNSDYEDAAVVVEHMDEEDSAVSDCDVVLCYMFSFL